MLFRPTEQLLHITLCKLVPFESINLRPVMIKEYYYLEGREQKGPVTVEQLKSVGISADTLVWAEGMENWLPSKDVEELQVLLKKLPPPIPDAPHQESAQNNDSKIIIENPDVKQWAIAKICLTIFLGLGIITAVCFTLVEAKKTRLKDEITSRINAIFKERSTIQDGENFSVQGSLRNTDYKKNTEAKKGKNLLKTKLGDFDLTDYVLDWGKTEKLYTVFECKNGGFTIKKLSKVGEDSFDLEVTESGDMGYRSPEFRRGITGYNFNNFGGGNVYGNVKGDRIPVQQYYNLAFEFYTKNDKTGTYTPGKLNDINGFSNIANEYFSIDNVFPTKATASTHFSNSWKSVGDHTGGLTWDDARLYCNLEGKHFEVILNKDSYNSDLFTYLGITAGVFTLLVVIVLMLTPKFFSNLSLYGKKWLNSENHTQILIFDHTFFGDNRFTDISTDEVLKGTLKISDKGTTLNLSYPNKEVFYKIDSIEDDSLSLIDIKTGKTILYKRLGASEQIDTPKTAN